MQTGTADRKIQQRLGRAVTHYQLIEDGDRIAVAFSGGKDSFSLLWLLKERLKWIPTRYELLAIHLDMGFEGARIQPIQEGCQALEVPLHLERTDYGLRAHGPENRENPCFLCARLRRKRLFELAQLLGCTKLAFGHNQDDLIETFFLNVFFSGVMSTMLPRQVMFEGALTIIRPLALIGEKEILNFARRMGLPKIENPCPSAQRSRRKEVKDLLAALYAGNRKVRGNIFHALSHAQPEYLPPPIHTGRFLKR